MPLVHILGNPFAGSGRVRNIAPKVAAAARAAGWEVELDLPDSLEALKRAAASVEADVAGVLGGDGTLNAVCCVLPSSVPILALPVGTANVVALELGLPLDPTAAAAVLADYETVAWDVGFAGDSHVLFSLSAGFDAEVVRLLARKRKGGLPSKLAYLSPVMEALTSFRPRPMNLLVDGEPLPEPCYQFTALNTKRYGGDIEVLPSADPADGVFDLVALTSPSLPDHVRYAAALVAGRADGLECTRLVRFKRLEATAAGPVPVQVDGEHHGSLPVILEVRPAFRSFVVPRRKE